MRLRAFERRWADRVARSFVPRGALDGAVDAGETDFVVIGSGAGGGAAARVLARAGHGVVVLEEGPLVRASATTPILHESLARLFRLGGRTAMLGRPPIPYLQGCCVGGTTFVNSAIVWRLPEKV